MGDALNIQQVVNIQMFGKALIEKSLWRLLRGEGLWNCIMRMKYIEPLSFNELLHKELNIYHNFSIVWKALANSFMIVGSWLTWKIINGLKVRVGIDPWFKVKGPYHFSLDLQDTLHNLNIYTLNDVALAIQTNPWQKECKLVKDIGL